MGMGKVCGVMFYLLLASGIVFAGGVYNYSPDVPLVQTPKGIDDKLNFLCNKASSDVSTIDDFTLSSYITQCGETRRAIRSNAMLKDKSAYLNDLRDCEKVFTTENSKRSVKQSVQKISNSLDRIQESYKRDIKVSGIDVRADRYDSIGNVWYSARAEVTNYGKSGTMRITLQGLDFDGAIRETVTLRGYIEHLKTAKLYTSYFMSASNFQSIREWRLQGDE